MVDSSELIDFRRQRRRGMLAISVVTPVAAAIWFTIALAAPAIPSMESFAARMAFTVKCLALAVLFCVVTGVEAIAHERLFSPAFDPLVSFETRRLRVNQRYLQNSLEQVVVFAAALFGLAAYSPDGSSMRTVIATTAVWIIARFAFWIGYHHSPAMRGLGAPGMMVSMLALLYVATRFGHDLAGTAGAVAIILLFAGIEAVLVWATASSPPDCHRRRTPRARQRPDGTCT